jgi:hypothetical protein
LWNAARGKGVEPKLVRPLPKNRPCASGTSTRYQADVGCGLRSGTPPCATQLRQTAGVTSAEVVYVGVPNDDRSIGRARHSGRDRASLTVSLGAGADSLTVSSGGTSVFAASSQSLSEQVSTSADDRARAVENAWPASLVTAGAGARGAESSSAGTRSSPAAAAPGDRSPRPCRPYGG